MQNRRKLDLLDYCKHMHALQMHYYELCKVLIEENTLVDFIVFY